MSISDDIYDALTADPRAGFSSPLSPTQEGNIRAWTDAIEEGLPDPSSGLTGTYRVKGSDGGTYTMTFTKGLLTATTLPD